MRTIQISTDVFQAIWAARQPGEETEDAILARRLSVPRTSPSPANEPKRGFYDSKYGVHFPEGFEIFRTYLGREYRGRVVDGAWHVNGARVAAGTINKLSAAIGTKTENGWVNWNYRDGATTRKSLLCATPLK